MRQSHQSLTLDHIVLRLKEREILRVEATIEPGHVLTIMGPSGSGKSSLLAFIGGFLDPAFTASGRVFSGDQELTRLPPEDRHAGILFQDPLLFPHLSVGRNIQFAIPQTVTAKAERRAIAEAALAEAGLGGFYDRHPDTLSGGQKARVALQRVLVSKPCALLLDEPFSKLDTDLRSQMRDLVFGQAKKAGLPVILVTHDPSDADAAGGDILHLGSDTPA